MPNDLALFALTLLQISCLICVGYCYGYVRGRRRGRREREWPYRRGEHPKYLRDTMLCDGRPVRETDHGLN